MHAGTRRAVTAEIAAASGGTEADRFYPDRGRASLSEVSFRTGFSVKCHPRGLMGHFSRSGGSNFKTERKSQMVHSARGLYLDLLIQTLTNMIYGDPSTGPAKPGPFQPTLRSEGCDWPLLAHTMVGVRRLKSLQELAQRALDEGIPGDFIEAGVWRGGCCIFMRGLLAANAITDRKVYVADSFAGLPPPSPTLYPADKGLHLEGFAELAVPLDQVKANFARYGLLDDQVVFVKGWFRDTLPVLDAGPFALLRLDGDLYESIYVTLDALYPKLSPGGFVIVDDFNLISQCQQAVLDYRQKMNVGAAMHEPDLNSIWWQKDK
jgi:O-methyltransferase